MSENPPRKKSTSVAERPVEAVQARTIKPPPMPVVRFSINLAQDSADILKGAARKKNITVTDATRRAIAIMALLDEELESGHAIQSVAPDGAITRIIFV